MSRSVRVHSTKVELLTPAGSLIGELAGVTGGKFEYSAASRIKSSGSLTLEGTISDINWLSTWIKPIYIVDGIEYPLGVFIPSAPEDTYTNGAAEVELELLDKVSALESASVQSSYIVPEGTNVVQAVKSLIELSGLDAGALTPSSKTTRGTIVWDPGTELIVIINELLDSANFFSLWCDGNGQFQVTPYQPPNARQVSFDFVDGATANYIDGFSHEQDIYSIPNRVIAKSKSAADEPPLVAVATNENIDSPYSFVNRGRWIDRIEADLEVTDQATLNDLAQRKLLDATGASKTIEIKHLFEPVSFNDVVTFYSEARHIQGLFTVSKMAVDFKDTGAVSTTLKEVSAV